MIKTLQKAGIGSRHVEAYFNIIKAIYDKITANIILNSEKLKAFPLKSGTRQGCWPSSIQTTIQHSFGSFSYSNQGRKRNKRHPDWKRSSKTLSADDMILYIENPKDTTRKLLELINELNIVKLQDIKLIHRNPLHSYILTMRK